MPKIELPGLSEETLEMLDAHVKKGKARKFFMVYKGASIKTLVVFKKGPFGPKIMKARKGGFKGEVVCGTITGKGRNLRLQLPGSAEVAEAMKAEGPVEKAPTKKTKLKEFLADNGLRLKPEYEIITQVGLLLDPESDEEVSIPGLDADNDDEAAPDEAGNSATLMAAFKTRVVSILPEVKAVGTTPASAEATAMVRQAGELAKQNSFYAANRVLDEVEALLVQLAGGTVDDEPGRKLANAVKKIKPLMVAAIQAEPSRKAEIGETVQQISGKIKATQYDLARENITKFVAFLKLLTRSVEPASQGNAGTDWQTAKASWQAASDTVDAQISKLQTALKKSNDLELVEIAESGLNAVTGNFKVPLMAAMRDIENSTTDDDPRAAAKVLAVIKGFRRHIESSQQVAAVDDNPVGVNVSIRRTLLDAFTAMENALQS